MKTSAGTKCGSHVDYWGLINCIIYPTLESLHWLPVSFRAQPDMLMNYKALNGLGPQYLLAYLYQKLATPSTHSSQSMLLQVEEGQ